MTRSKQGHAQPEQRAAAVVRCFAGPAPPSPAAAPAPPGNPRNHPAEPPLARFQLSQVVRKHPGHACDRRRHAAAHAPNLYRLEWHDERFCIGLTTPYSALARPMSTGGDHTAKRPNLCAPPPAPRQPTASKPARSAQPTRLNHAVPAPGAATTRARAIPRTEHPPTLRDGCGRSRRFRSLADRCDIPAERRSGRLGG